MFRMKILISGLLGLMSLCAFRAHPQQLASPRLGNFTGSLAKNSDELVHITREVVRNQWQKLEKKAREEKIGVELAKANYRTTLEEHTQHKTSLKHQFVYEYKKLRLKEPLTQEEIHDFKDTHLLVEVGFPQDPQELKEIILNTQAELVRNQIVAFLIPAAESSCTIL